MAIAIDFQERNDYIGKPPEMTDNQCYALPVCRLLTSIPGENPDDPPVLSHAHISCWQLTPEERDEVARTGVVYLQVIGLTTFPLSIHGVLPIRPDDVIPSIDELKAMKGDV